MATLISGAGRPVGPNPEKSMGLILDTPAVIAMERAAAAGAPILLDPSEFYALPAMV